MYGVKANNDWRFVMKNFFEMADSEIGEVMATSGDDYLENSIFPLITEDDRDYYDNLFKYKKLSEMNNEELVKVVIYLARTVSAANSGIDELMDMVETFRETQNKGPEKKVFLN